MYNIEGKIINTVFYKLQCANHSTTEILLYKTCLVYNNLDGVDVDAFFLNYSHVRLLL